MYKFLVVDDSVSDINLLEDALRLELSKYGLCYEILLASQPQDINSHCFYDAVFLDIEFPYTSGFDISKNFSIETPIIYISHREDLGYQACNYHPFGFVRKQYLSQELPLIINRLVLKINKYLSVQHQKQDIKIPYKDIIYIESDKHCVYIHTKQQIYQLRDTIKHISDMISDPQFHIIHQSFLVNFIYIIKIENNEVILFNHQKLPISQRRYKEIEILYFQNKLRRL